MLFALRILLALLLGANQLDFIHMIEPDGWGIILRLSDCRLYLLHQHICGENFTCTVGRGNNIPHAGQLLLSSS